MGAKAIAGKSTHGEAMKSLRCTIPAKLLPYRVEVQYIPARDAWMAGAAAPTLKLVEAPTVNAALKALAALVPSKRLPKRAKKARPRSRLQRLLGKDII